MIEAAENDGEQDRVPDSHAHDGRLRPRKTADAFRTISEVADELHVPQHVLRFWETKFPQVRPLKRGGGRRYYRPEDVSLLRQVADLLYTQGYTIKGVQRLLREGGGALQDNIPPASAEERRAAEAERDDLAPAVPRPVRLPELPLPEQGTLPEPHRYPAAPPPPAAEQEAERLRNLLTETLQALEGLRRSLG